VSSELLKELRRQVEAVSDREEARRLYDQVMSIAARLSVKFSFGKSRKRKR
jgi:hypothetical protein